MAENKHQRIVFVNLHTDWMMVRASSVIIFKNSPALKHAYILDYLLKNPDYEVASLLNDRSFSIYTHGGDKFQWMLNLLSPVEHRWILHKNHIPHSKVRRLKSVADIRPDDIVIFYNLMREEYRHMEEIDAFKALGMLHFHGRADDAQLMQKAGIDCFFNEADLSKSCKLFQKYYPIERPWVVIPFVFAERFKPLKPFGERQNKCFSTGTITYKKHEEFLSVYGDPCDQPARKMVKDNAEFFADTVDCYSSDYLEDNPGKTVKPGDNAVVRTYKRLYNRTHIGKQKKYFSFDMVEKFNDYKMHLLGEEILGVPGIGYVEGMACGSAYIGLDSPMYRDLGLEPGVHYIVYDGTAEGLRETVRYWQREENQGELEKIAERGCRYVRENFCGEKVAEKLIRELERLQGEWKSKRANCD